MMMMRAADEGQRKKKNKKKKMKKKRKKEKEASTVRSKKIDFCTRNVRENVLNCTGGHLYTDHSFQVTTISGITKPFSLEWKKQVSTLFHIDSTGQSHVAKCYKKS